MPDNGRLISCTLRLLPLGLLVAGGGLFLALGGRHYLTFAALADNREWLCGLVARSEVAAVIAFIAAYAGLTALSMPAAAIMTVAGGFLFGTWLGLGSALVGATLGAVAGFLAARWALAGLAERIGPRFRRVEAELRSDAINYLLVLRLVPVFPFWLVNLVAGVVGIRLAPFLAATFIGMIPAAFIYASLGDGLGKMVAQGHSPDYCLACRKDVLLPLLGLAVLALLPVLYKRWRARQGKQPA
ncbi:MAG TPA: VTT domain-containing protein [Stellaceae bacterium]|nr:VTT domain-containing protein [Stellaceae bacterium]